jgi:hypothetical protein
MSCAFQSFALTATHLVEEAAKSQMTIHLMGVGFMRGEVTSDEPRDRWANSLYNRHQHKDNAPPGVRNEKSMESSFTWIPIYSELAGLLVDWEDRQPDLIACLDNLRSDSETGPSFRGCLGHREDFPFHRVR